jgi:hypothetical protein
MISKGKYGFIERSEVTSGCIENREMGPEYSIASAGRRASSLPLRTKNLLGR